MVDIEKLEDASYSNEIVKMYERLNTELVNDILRKINEYNNISTFTKSQLRKLAKRGGIELFKQALIKTNRLSASRKSELLQLFSKIINEDLSDYKDLYEERDKPFELSKSQLKLLNKMVKLTDKELKNFTRSIAFRTQQEFISAVDDMYVQVVTGGIDYQTAFRKTTNKLAEKGITLVTKGGVHRSLEAAVRQNVLYGARRTSQLINDDLIEELEADAVQINISQNCRDSHIPINGKVFSLKKNGKYPYFAKGLSNLLNDYGCQHYKSPFIIGVSKPIYSNSEIKKINNRKVNFKGEKVPYYEATQMQRALERNIRNTKKAYMNSQTKENRQKVSLAQKKMRNFIKETGLERKYNREYYAGYNH